MGSPKLPFPFLQNLLDNISPPTKKMQFTYDNKKQYLKHITNQIQDKAQREQQNHVNKIMDERKDLQNYRVKML